MPCFNAGPEGLIGGVTKFSMLKGLNTHAGFELVSDAEAEVFLLMLSPMPTPMAMAAATASAIYNTIFIFLPIRCVELLEIVRTLSVATSLSCPSGRA